MKRQLKQALQSDLYSAAMPILISTIIVQPFSIHPILRGNPTWEESVENKASDLQICATSFSMVTHPLQYEDDDPQGCHLLLTREVNQCVEVVEAVLLGRGLGHALDVQQIQATNDLRRSSRAVVRREQR